MFGGSADSNGFGRYSTNAGGFGSDARRKSDEVNSVFSFIPSGPKPSSSVFKNGDSMAMNEFGESSRGGFSGGSPSFVSGTGGFGLGAGGNQMVSSVPAQGNSTFSFGRVASDLNASWDWDPAFRSSSLPVAGSSGTKSHVGGFTIGSCPTTDSLRTYSFIPGSCSFLPRDPLAALSEPPSFNGGTFIFGSNPTPFKIKNTSNAPAFGNTGNAVAPSYRHAFDGASRPPGSFLSGNSAFRSGSNIRSAVNFPPGGGNKVKPYSPTAVVDITGKKTAEKLQSKSAMPDHLGKSHEEMRWEDYQCNRGYRRANSTIRHYPKIGSDAILSLPMTSDMPCPAQPFPSFSVEKHAKGFGTVTVPYPTFATHPLPTPLGVTFESKSNSSNCCPASTSTTWWAVPQPAQVSVPTDIPVVPTGQSPSSFSFFPERAKPAQETEVLHGKDPLQTSQGLTVSTGLLDSPSIPSQPNFNQSCLVSGTGDVMPLITANPFGSHRETNPNTISLLHSGSVSLIQRGLSSLPIGRELTPVKTSSLLSCRHLSRSRIKLTARKPPPISDGPKVPFFYSNDEIPRATKRQFLITTRDNPKAWIVNPAPLWSPTNNPDTASSANIESMSNTISGNLNERVTKEDIKVNAGLGIPTTQGEKLRESSKEKDTLQLPKLQLPDYYTEPSMEELAAKEKAEPGFLSHVKDFVIGRHGYGHVKFKGETDVRQLDIESILKFSDREVTVYTNESTKPPIGQGLNKAAEITLLNITFLGNKTGQKTDKYKKVLIQKCEDNGAKFISYDPVGGEWKFSVPHFSCNA